MGVRRRQPAGACLGRLARLPDGSRAERHRRPAVPRTHLSQTDAELHLVGEPQGRRWPQHLPGRVSRPRQYRHLRPQCAAADRRPHQPVGRHRLDGDVHAQPDAHRPSLAEDNHVYEDIATKFFEHFLYIAEAMTNIGGSGIGLWDEEDEFYYDVLNLPGGRGVPLRVRSMVGLIPLFAVEVLDGCVFSRLPEFARRLRWFLEYRPDLARLVSRWTDPNADERHLLSLLRGHRMKRLLARMLDETEFLSDHGIRAVSKYHEDSPFAFEHEENRFSIGYVPGESDSGVFGGNSNWRGPIWMPVNFLLIESLRRFHRYYGDDFTVECPVGSGQFLDLAQVSDELSRRLSRLFLKNADGRRPVFGDSPRHQHDPAFRDHVLFHEYFHGDT